MDILISNSDTSLDYEVNIIDRVASIETSAAQQIINLNQIRDQITTVISEMSAMKSLMSTTNNLLTSINSGVKATVDALNGTLDVKSPALTSVNISQSLLSTPIKVIVVDPV